VSTRPTAPEKPGTPIATLPRYGDGHASSVVERDEGAKPPAPKPTRNRMKRRYEKLLAK